MSKCRNFIVAYIKLECFFQIAEQILREFTTNNDPKCFIPTGPTAQFPVIQRSSSFMIFVWTCLPDQIMSNPAYSSTQKMKGIKERNKRTRFHNNTIKYYYYFVAWDGNRCFYIVQNVARDEMRAARRSLTPQGVQCKDAGDYV